MKVIYALYELNAKKSMGYLLSSKLLISLINSFNFLFIGNGGFEHLQSISNE